MKKPSKSDGLHGLKPKEFGQNIKVENKNVERRTGVIKFTPVFYEGYLPPEGFLSRNVACHALWHYYLLARKTWEEVVNDPMFLEGTTDHPTNFKQQFTTCATIYGVTPEQMVKFWSNVDMQCTVLMLPKMPDEDRYRFDKTPEIKTQ